MVETESSEIFSLESSLYRVLTNIIQYQRGLPFF